MRANMVRPRDQVEINDKWWEVVDTKIVQSIVILICNPGYGELQELAFGKEENVVVRGYDSRHYRTTTPRKPFPGYETDGKTYRWTCSKCKIRSLVEFPTPEEAEKWRIQHEKGCTVVIDAEFRQKSEANPGGDREIDPE